MSNPLALIVDDEPDIRELLEITLARMNINARTADSLESARALLRKEKFQLCLTDMRLPDGDGLEIVRFIAEQYPHMPVAVITATLLGAVPASVWWNPMRCPRGESERLWFRRQGRFCNLSVFGMSSSKRGIFRVRGMPRLGAGINWRRGISFSIRMGMPGN